MQLCPHCSQTLSENALSCSHCNHFLEHQNNLIDSDVNNSKSVSSRAIVETEEWDFGEESEEQLIAIARFSNIAEAGFFAHELASREKISAEVTPDENFDAINGYWSTWFVLSVPTALEDHAKSVLHKLILDADAQDFENEAGTQHLGVGHRTTKLPTIDDEVHEYQDAFSEENHINWIPIMLTLTAGSVAFWAARKLNEQPPIQAKGIPAGQKIDELWDYLDDNPNPWIQKLEKGQGVRQLHIDASHQRFIIREDLDGDGQFEREIP